MLLEFYVVVLGMHAVIFGYEGMSLTSIHMDNETTKFGIINFMLKKKLK